MRRSWIWLLVVGWSLVWAMLLGLLVTAHPDVTLPAAVQIATRLIVAAAILALGVQPLIQRFPWPHPMRATFIAVHAVAAVAFAFGWICLNSLFASIVHRQLTFALGIGLWPFVFQGIWLYVMVTGVGYAAQATRRAARIEALAARAQLEALRAQLNPHFLFNALHTVVHLIPRQPERAAQAAEQLAGLLRTTIETDRDVVSLESEWNFVERYLEIERIRFGDRLDVRVDLGPQARAAVVPSFALQTLVENAVRHGAMPRVEPTTLSITARLEGGMLIATVHDNGMGADAAQMAASDGTGLRRLRERLAALYDGRASLETAPGAAGGFTATLAVPQTWPDADA